jgi:AcrR family transcriptional regulator
MSSPNPTPPEGATAGRRIRSRRGEGETLREEVLVAAEHLLIAAGSEDAVSVRAVAAAVGVSPAAIYLHFPDKDALMRAVCGRVFGVFDAALEAAAADATDPLDDLFRRARAYVTFGLSNPGQYQIIFLAKNDPRWADIPWDERPGAEAFGHLVAAVSRAMDAGVMVRENPELVAAGLWTCVHGLTALLITMTTFPWPPVEALTCHVVGTYLRGLSTQPGPVPGPRAARPDEATRGRPRSRRARART